MTTERLNIRVNQVENGYTVNIETKVPVKDKKNYDDYNYDYDYATKEYICQTKDEVKQLISENL